MANLTAGKIRQLECWLERALACRITIASVRELSGGDINQAWRLETDRGRFFLKYNEAEGQEGNRNFETEVGSLAALRACDALRVPRVICCQRWQGGNYLVLEHLSLRPERGAALGQALARLHREHQGSAYGWAENNFIGLTPQYNGAIKSWATFYARFRIGPQLTLANQRGAKLGDVEAWVEQIETRLAGHHPPPSLLHGDLWAGNAASTTDAEPVLFDPACFYGDRETDLAMTRLFGGFAPSFYSAYEAQWPLDPGYYERESLYQLYHILNHFNLFGGNYRGQAERILKSLP
ncbi:fructosamine kinase family protein [Aestuariirhabdus sp. LZHN29]|uniref:fructosamine kinase family protein n=1 Tax=Aestuariirhabdus sp. LZHN29 TaxID=3417462 RepID=UPI003CF28B2B